MKIQCNACEAAEANVLCCADEAALCWRCDQKIHAANKLASKHQRVPLSTSSSSSPMPKCDICQETAGYFFCLEDRALLCRKFDVAIHTANSYVSNHQRFLHTGVKVGLEATEPCVSSTMEKLNSTEKFSETQPVSRSSSLISFTGENREVLPGQIGGNGTLVTNKLPLATPNGDIPDWRLDECLGSINYNQNYGDLGSVLSKVYGRYCL